MKKSALLICLSSLFIAGTALASQDRYVCRSADKDAKEFELPARLGIVIGDEKVQIVDFAARTKTTARLDSDYRPTKANAGFLRYLSPSHKTILYVLVDKKMLQGAEKARLKVGIMVDPYHGQVGHFRYFCEN